MFLACQHGHCSLTCSGQGFESILERFASLTMNSQAGIFVFLMLLASRKVQGADIPAPLSSWFQKLLWTIPIFFNAAVVMDVYNTIRDWLHPVKLLPIVMTNSTLHGNPPVEVVVGGNWRGELGVAVYASENGGGERVWLHCVCPTLCHGDEKHSVSSCLRLSCVCVCKMAPTMKVIYSICNWFLLYALLYFVIMKWWSL